MATNNEQKDKERMIDLVARIEEKIKSWPEGLRYQLNVEPVNENKESAPHHEKGTLR